jgi:hypothetical protein
MDRDIARLKPANTTTPARVVLPRQEILRAPFHDKARLLDHVHEMARRGEIGSTYDIREVKHGWAVKVVRIAERPNWWRRNGLRASLWAGGALVFLTLLVILLRLLAMALAAVLPLLVGAVILIMVCSAVAMLGGGGSIEVLQKVKIRR